VPVANKAEPRSGDLAPRVIPSDTGLDGGGESFHPDATSGPLGEIERTPRRSSDSSWVEARMKRDSRDQSCTPDRHRSVTAPIPDENRVPT